MNKPEKSENDLIQEIKKVEIKEKNEENDQEPKIENEAKNKHIQEEEIPKNSFINTTPIKIKMKPANSQDDQMKKIPSVKKFSDEKPKEKLSDSIEIQSELITAIKKQKAFEKEEIQKFENNDHFKFRDKKEISNQANFENELKEFDIENIDFQQPKYSPRQKRFTKEIFDKDNEDYVSKENFQNTNKIRENIDPINIQTLKNPVEDLQEIKDLGFDNNQRNLEENSSLLIEKKEKNKVSNQQMYLNQNPFQIQAAFNENYSQENHKLLRFEHPKLNSKGWDDWDEEIEKDYGISNKNLSVQNNQKFYNNELGKFSNQNKLNIENDWESWD